MRGHHRENCSRARTSPMHKQVTLSRRAIPSVTKVLDSLGKIDLPRPVVVTIVRQELSRIRAKGEIPEFRSIVDLVRGSLEQLRASRLQPVINGTGIVIHTNVGRAPLAPEAVQALKEVGSAYSNLEYDLVTGERGRRGTYIENTLALLCGAEAATVVNNCAAALVLIVQHFTRNKPEIVISRGEMVQIGGGFRIGEILGATGATLREVGATNKTTLADYMRTINRQTAMILKVHRSNFFMSGFVESPSSAAIAGLARKKRVPFVEDLGSGAMVATEEFGIPEHEPTPAEALKDGADLVCFSGDKLFGGPQAGIVAGKKRFVAALKREPLFRALRCDKLIFAALQSTVDLHLNESTSEIPALALLRISRDELRARAAAIFARLRGLPLQITIGRGAVKAGGGTLPRSMISSITIDIVPENCSVRDFATSLRTSVPPVVGYIANERFKLDLRTIFTHQDDAVIDAIRSACAGTH
ncbi:MAG: L-seryl-tRNA(Sec) selenium transferase [Verrucomicrobia bacterium]|nr:MAG: L-seryl-tRNA(Sec) selenium transferase [Verrucomicrobiota bacterium]